MKKNENENYDIGVLVGRFQIDKLHAAHKSLLDTLVEKHQKAIVFLGEAPTIATRRNPLDFKSRENMLRASYPDLTIIPIQDKNNDEIWSATLDEKIREVYKIGSVVLYGGRDSFIAHYHGKFPTVELEGPDSLINASALRKQISREVGHTPEFRAGLIYSSLNQFPKVIPTVDVAVFNEDKTKILLAKKLHEKKYRFIGGYADPSDPHFEMAAVRELHEETGHGGNFSLMKYVGSFNVNDWRYVKEDDKIITTLFECTHLWGPLEPRDDIAELKWFDVHTFSKEGAMARQIEPVHHKLFITLFGTYNWFKDETDVLDEKN